MAILSGCVCANPECENGYSFYSGSVHLCGDSYWEHHREITRDIAAGKYGDVLRSAMVSSDSVYLERRKEYRYCPCCDTMGFGGRIQVYLHREGKSAQLKQDEWEGDYYLDGWDIMSDYEEILTLPDPCWRCGAPLRYFDRYEDIRCPRCGSSMQAGRLGRKPSTKENRAKDPDLDTARDSDGASLTRCGRSEEGVLLSEIDLEELFRIDNDTSDDIPTKRRKRAGNRATPVHTHARRQLLKEKRTAKVRRLKA